MLKKYIYFCLITLTAAFLSACSESKNDIKVLNAISISPDTIKVATGTTTVLEALGHFSDESTQTLQSEIEWSSSDESIALIDADGALQGLSDGNCTITVSTTDRLPNGESIFSFSAAAQVINTALLSISIEPDTPTLALGLSRQLSALGSYDANFTQDISNDVLWSSSNLAILTMSNAAGSKGLIEALSEDNATVRALESNSGIDATLEITVTSAVATGLSVTPKNTTIVTADTQQYEAVATLSDATGLNVTADANWSSSDTTVATIDAATALARALSEGSTTISATYGSLTSQTTLTVTLHDQLQILRDNDGIFEAIDAPYICDLDSDCYKEKNVTVSGIDDVRVKRFKLKAIGSDFKITDLTAEDKDGVLTPYFEDLSENQVIAEGEEQIFSLVSPQTGGVVKELEWSFTVDNNSSLYFIEGYKFKSN